MRVGKHKTDGNNDWKIGDMPITETESYKYLGDVITNDGKNASNIKNRKDKAISTTIAIKTIATNDIFRDIETSVITADWFDNQCSQASVTVFSSGETIIWRPLCKQEQTTSKVAARYKDP